MRAPRSPRAIVAADATRSPLRALMLREMSIVACSVYMLLPVICFCFVRRTPGEYSARCAHGRASPIQDRRQSPRLISNAQRASRFRFLIYRLDPIRGSASVSKDQARCPEVEQTINQLLQRTMQLIVRAREPLNSRWIALDSENTLRPRQRTGTS